MAAWTGNGVISGKNRDEVRAALDRVTRQAQTRGTTALLAQPVTTADQAELTGPHTTTVLPAHPSLLPLLPWPGGIRRGATVAALGGQSLLMLLLAGAMTGTGSWAAVVGMPRFGVLAAVQDYGVRAGRLALVPEPGPDWPTIVATLLDGLDVVVVHPPADVAPGLVTSLQARARKTGAVLIPTRNWPGSDVVLEATGLRWQGLGAGHGRLRHAALTLTSTGRGKAHRARTTTVSVPPGAKRPPLRFPPPSAPARPVPEQGTDNGLWAHVEPTPPATNWWGGLTPVR